MSQIKRRDFLKLVGTTIVGVPLSMGDVQAKPSLPAPLPVDIEPRQPPNAAPLGLGSKVMLNGDFIGHSIEYTIPAIDSEDQQELPNTLTFQALDREKWRDLLMWCQWRTGVWVFGFGYGSICFDGSWFVVSVSMDGYGIEPQCIVTVALSNTRRDTVS